jgi:MoaA/NifB/PqqE/SkfB family radical SAM enzyme
MSQLEFEKRKQYLCKAPFSGLTVNPTGSITLCCSGGPVTTPLGHISEVDSLQQFYNSEIMENVRILHENKAIEQSVCAGCYRQYAAGKHNMMTIYNNFWDWTKRNFDNDWYDRKADIDRPLRFLEYTCSNICNQTCASCSSWFSSKWRDYELAFTLDQQEHFDKTPKPILRLTEKDIDKIVDVLPHLDFLSMKGGEPWADKNNVKILEQLLKVNPSCTVDIISNMQSIPESTWKMLGSVDHSLTNLWLSASIDGVGKEYNWIRGGNFNKTVENLERWHEVTKKKIRINPFVSIFNFFSLDKIVDYFISKPYVTGVTISNIGTYPTYIKAQNLPSFIVAEQVEYYKTKFNSYDQLSGKLYCSPLLNNINEKSTNLEELKKSFEWIEVINKMRGFDLLDHVPELKRIKEVVCDD